MKQKHGDIAIIEGNNELNVQMTPIFVPPVEETLIAYGGAVVAAWRDFPTSYGTVHNLTSGDSVGPGGYIGQWRDEYGWFISRGFVTFNTRPICGYELCPAGKIIKAVLQIYGTRDLSATDFDIVVQKGSYYSPSTDPTKGDFDYRYYSGDGGRLPTASFKTGAYNNIELNADGISWIGWKSGLTALAIRSSRDIATRAPSGDEAVAVELGPTLFHPPRLIITYQG